MEKLDASIKKMNFKKVLMIYVACALAVGIAFSGFIGYKFRDKLATVYGASRIEESFENGNKDSSAIKPDLTSLAKSSTDIVDILILDNSNKILFSAENSVLAKSGTFELKRDESRDNDYLYVESLPDTQFGLLENKDTFMDLAIKNISKIKERHKDDYFYEGNLKDKTIYALSYASNKESGEKIYIISDIKPVPHGELYLKAAAAAVMLFFMAYWLLVTFWVYRDSAKSKLNPLLWGTIALFTNLAGLFVYLIYKSINVTCYKCGALQQRESLYCTSCGTKIGNTCPSCGAMVESKDDYCTKCGGKLHKNE